MSIINCTAYDCQHHKNGKCAYNTITSMPVSTNNPCVYFSNKNQNYNNSGFTMTNNK